MPAAGRESPPPREDPALTMVTRRKREVASRNSQKLCRHPLPETTAQDRFWCSGRHNRRLGIIDVSRARHARGPRPPASAPRPGAGCPRCTPTGTRRSAGNGRPGTRTGRSSGPPISGPCRTSPVHSTFGASASNRPNTGAPPRGVARSSPREVPLQRPLRRRPPAVRPMIRRTCAAVRSGSPSSAPPPAPARSARSAARTRAARGTAPRTRPRAMPGSTCPWSYATPARPRPPGPACTRPAMPRTTRPAAGRSAPARAPARSAGTGTTRRPGPWPAAAPLFLFRLAHAHQEHLLRS